MIIWRESEITEIKQYFILLDTSPATRHLLFPQGVHLKSAFGASAMIAYGAKLTFQFTKCDENQEIIQIMVSFGAKITHH